MTAWPGIGHSQGSSTPVLGFLNGGSPEGFARFAGAFRQGLGEIGYAEGRNLVIESRWAEGRYERLPALAAELVHKKVSVLAASGGVRTAVAAKAATDTIPIVFSGGGGDPVGFGLITSLARPGGNVTGVSILTAELGAKRVSLLHEMIPHAASIAAMINPANPNSIGQSKDIEEAGRALGLRMFILNASAEHDFESVFRSIAEKGGKALVVGADPFFFSQRELLTALAARYAIPAIYEWRDYAEAGGLMSYGTSPMEIWRQFGIYTGRILKGEKPADLPVLQPTTFELVINLKTARSLGLKVPDALLLQADGVIE
jgi:putative ABC transport system substrate-binding protein